MSDPMPGTAPATPVPVAAPIPTPMPTSPAASSNHVDTAVACWWAQHIHNSPIAQATAAYNHLLSVLPHLKQALTKEI